MKKILLFPHESLNEIYLGWTRKEVRERFGVPHSSTKMTDFYHHSESISVHFDSNDLVVYIELANPENSEIKVLLNDLDIFNTEVDTLILLLKKELGSDFDINNPEIGYSFIYNKIDVAFWRPVIPECENDNDGKYFSSVGIGAKGYFDCN